MNTLQSLLCVTSRRQSLTENKKLAHPCSRVSICLTNLWKCTKHSFKDVFQSNAPSLFLGANQMCGFTSLSSSVNTCTEASSRYFKWWRRRLLNDVKASHRDRLYVFFRSTKWISSPSKVDVKGISYRTIQPNLIASQNFMQQFQSKGQVTRFSDLENRIIVLVFFSFHLILNFGWKVK